MLQKLRELSLSKKERFPEEASGIRSSELKGMTEEDEGLSFAKGARELPPYMRLELSFTPRMLEHPTKEAVKDEIRVMNTELRKITLCKLSEMVAHNILEVSKELVMKMQELDEELLKSQRYSERRDFFKVVQELIEEYKEKLRRYKETIARKPTQSGFKPKNKFKRKF
ncbi:unnamed protein product [Mytilus coruscus]|uniref:Uncharacterized protein n=1 Tax=Mytilus coruscus TaxID=42192 RepID=A0A6J8EEX8_MYTCO|nr:unnamed protein product [Mytilus coruscus]